MQRLHLQEYWGGATKLTAFVFDSSYVKGNTIPHVDTLSWLKSHDTNLANNNNDSFIHWIETDVLCLLDSLALETLHDHI